MQSDNVLLVLSFEFANNQISVYDKKHCSAMSFGEIVCFVISWPLYDKKESYRVYWK